MWGAASSVSGDRSRVTFHTRTRTEAEELLRGRARGEHVGGCGGLKESYQEGLKRIIWRERKSGSKMKGVTYEAFVPRGEGEMKERGVAIFH